MVTNSKRVLGFTIIEMIAVLVIVGILAVSVSSRFLDNNAFMVQASRDDTVAALFFAQQVAMARSTSSNPVRFISSGSAISVTENGNNLVNGSVQYPLALPSGFSLTPANLLFDKLGRTSAATLTLSKGAVSVDVMVSESGYAR